MIHTYIYIQGDNNLLTKINRKKVLKSEQNVSSQRILDEIKNLERAIRARKFLLIIICRSNLLYPEWQVLICQFRQDMGVGWGQWLFCLPPIKLLWEGAVPCCRPPCSYAYDSEFWNDDTRQNSCDYLLT